MRLGHWAGDGWRETEKSNFGWVCGEVQTLSPYATLSANTGAAQRPANKKNGHCRLHGGASTGAKAEDGLARIPAATLRHGKFTKNKLENRLAVRRPSRYLSVSSWFEVFAIAKDHQQFIGYVTLFYFRATG